MQGILNIVSGAQTLTAKDHQRMADTLSGYAGEVAELCWYEFYQGIGSEWAATFQTELGAYRAAWKFKHQADLLEVKQSAQGKWMVNKRLK